MKNDNTRELVGLSLYAALIIVNSLSGALSCF